MKIALLIERDRESANLVAALLEPWEFAVTTVPSPAEALTVLNAAHPDVIVCDIAAPISDAFTFIRELRNSPTETLRSIPVVATTTSDDVDAKAARAAGFNLLVRKPLEPAYFPRIVTLVAAAASSGAPPSDEP